MPERGHTSVHRSDSVHIKVGHFFSFSVAQRGSQRCPSPEFTSHGLAGKIPPGNLVRVELTFSWELLGTLLVALSVNKHLPCCLKMLHADRHLMYYRLPVALSPKGYGQLVVEFPPVEQERASGMLGPQAMLIFSCICHMSLASAFFQRVQNRSLCYL